MWDGVCCAAAPAGCGRVMVVVCGWCRRGCPSKRSGLPGEWREGSPMDIALEVSGHIDVERVADPEPRPEPGKDQASAADASTRALQVFTSMLSSGCRTSVSTRAMPFAAALETRTETLRRMFLQRQELWGK